MKKKAALYIFSFIILLLPFSIKAEAVNGSERTIRFNVKAYADSVLTSSKELMSVNPERARLLLHNAVRKISDSSYSSEKSLLYKQLASTYYRLGKYNSAIDYNKKALTCLTDSQHDSALGSIYNNFGVFYKAAGNYKAALEYNEKAREIFEKNDSKSKVAVILINMGNIAALMNNTEAASEYFQRSIALCKENNFDKLLIMAYINYGLACNMNGMPDKAVKNFKEALKHSKLINDNLNITKSHNNLGLVYFESGKYEKALAEYEESLQHKLSIGDSLSIASTLNNIGLIYDRSGKFFQALSHYSQALDIQKRKKKDTNLVRYLNNIAGIYQNYGLGKNESRFADNIQDIEKEISNSDESFLNWYYLNLSSINSRKDFTNKSLDFSKEALEIADELSYTEGKITALNNIGLVYDSQKKTDLALEYYKKAYNLQKRKQYKGNLGLLEYNIGNLYLQKGDNQTALKYMLAGLKAAEQKNEPTQLMNYHFAISKAYANLFNFKKAYFHYNQYVAAKDVVYNKNNQKVIAELKEKYDAEANEQENKLLINELEIKELQNHRQRMMSAFISVTALLILFILIFIYGRYRQKNKTAIKLKEIVEDKTRHLTSEIKERKQIEDELRVERNMFFNIFHNSPYGMVLYENGKIKLLNPECINILGYQLSDLTDLETVLNAVSTNEEQKSKLQNIITRELKGAEGIRDFELKMMTKDGVQRDIEIRLTFLTNDAVIAILSDVTKKKQSELNLKKRESQYRNLVENSPTGIISIDDRGNVININQKMIEIVDLPLIEDLFAIRFFEFSLFSNSGIADDFKQCLKDGCPAVYEKQVQTEKNGLLVLRYHLNPIDDAEGNIVGVQANFEDITSRISSEKARVRLEKAIEQAHECVMITDKDCIIQYINPAVTNISGYTSEEIIGRKPSILHSGEHNKDFYDKLKTTISSGFIWSGHFINKRKDGTNYEENATITPIKNEHGEITNYVAVKRDVTEQLRLESQLRQAQKMEAIGTLAAGIAHDFNNILNILLQRNELVMLYAESMPKIHSKLKESERTIYRAKDLVTQILAFSRQSEQEVKCVEARIIVKEASTIIRASIPSTINIVKGKLCYSKIYADPTQLYQVIVNLVTNAYHAMQDTGGTITLGLEDVIYKDIPEAVKQDLEYQDYVRFSISDTGPGIPPHILERIFDPYFTTKAKGRGTGMGLSIVHGIVKSYGGAIDVNTEIGVGTTFNIYFPLAVQDVEETSLNRNSTHKKGNAKVMFVDDEEDLVELFKEGLERYGYSVDSFVSSIDALEAFKANPYNYEILISDYTMPGLTGLQLADAISRIRDKFPIIICSGLSEELSASIAEKAGIRDIIKKPVSISDLVDIIESHITV